MKKFLFAMLAALLLFTAAACSSGPEGGGQEQEAGVEAGSSATPTSTPAVTGGGALSLEGDFDVYEEGESIFKWSEAGDVTYISFANAQSTDYAGQVLETSRGIKIGSTVEEVGEAYKNAVVQVIFPTTTKVTTKNFSDFLKDYEDGEYDFIVSDEQRFDYNVFYNLYFVDGELMDTAAYEEYLEGLEEGQFEEKWTNGEIKGYYIRLDIKDGLVADVTISAPTS